MRVPAIALAVTFCAGTVACVLFVPSPEETSGSTCGLTKDERATACGTCLQKSCQAALDDCCGAGKTCESVIGAIALCKSDDSKCMSPGSSTAETSLRACAKASCGSSCGDAVPIEKDAAPPVQVVCTPLSTDDCACQALSDAGSSQGRCTSSSGAGTRQCCAEEGFPAVPGKVCVCRPKYCLNDGSGGCTCGYYGNQSSKSLSICFSPSRGICCKNATSTMCTCYSNTTVCPSSMTETSSCSASDLACLIDENDVNTKRVTSCRE